MVASSKSFRVSGNPVRRDIIARHYTTFQRAARWTTTAVNLESSQQGAKRFPVLASVFPDQTLQPHIHDFDVELYHGSKVTRLRVFLKRGPKLGLEKNRYQYAAGVDSEVIIMRLDAASGTLVVNMRAGDDRMAAFVFKAARERILKFQSEKSSRLPRLLKVQRKSAFRARA